MKTQATKTRKPKQTVWEVEALIGIRCDFNGFAVRIHWADYGEEERSWESLECIKYYDEDGVNQAMLDRMWAHLTERHNISQEKFENGGYTATTLWVSRKFHRDGHRFFKMTYRNEVVEKHGPQHDDNDDVLDPDQKNDKTYEQRYAAWRAINIEPHEDDMLPAPPDKSGRRRSVTTYLDAPSRPFVMLEDINMFATACLWNEIATLLAIEYVYSYPRS
ncbi:hypothetical protein BDZ89DRAFT_1144392 [Hymenopellis radicata]|nr:hypothetical protein BDZ89DRAFT_1144392 [Hymenopellis radicata]